MASNPRCATDLQCKVGQVTKLPSTSVSSSLKLGLTWGDVYKMPNIHAYSYIHTLHTYRLHFITVYFPRKEM